MINDESSQKELRELLVVDHERPSTHKYDDVCFRKVLPDRLKRVLRGKIREQFYLDHVLLKSHGLLQSVALELLNVDFGEVVFADRVSFPLEELVLPLGDQGIWDLEEECVGLVDFGKGE